MRRLRGGHKFYQHGGYDLPGSAGGAEEFTAGQSQGAAHYQQLARNSLRSGKTFRRKLLEIFLSRRIEERFGKQKIMELYLNRIYFGGGLYGAEAASRGYFGKPAHGMSLAESATLAGLIKSPNKLSPWSDKAASRDARNVVLARMRDLGFITRAQCEIAQAEDIVIGSRQSAQGQTYAVDYSSSRTPRSLGPRQCMGYDSHHDDAELIGARIVEALLAQVEDRRLQHFVQSFALAIKR